MKMTIMMKVVMTMMMMMMMLMMIALSPNEMGKEAAATLDCPELSPQPPKPQTGRESLNFKPKTLGTASTQ